MLFKDWGLLNGGERWEYRNEGCLKYEGTEEETYCFRVFVNRVGMVAVVMDAGCGSVDVLWSNDVGCGCQDLSR